MAEVRVVLSWTRRDLVLCALSILLKLKVCIFLKGTSALVNAWCSCLKLVRGVMCVGFSSCLEDVNRKFQHVSSCVGFVKYEAQWLLMPSSLCSHLLSTTQFGFTFLTLFLMFKSFSWPASHISCLAVYSWWVWVLLWQRFLRSSAWHWAHVDYSNLPCYWRLLFSVIITVTNVAQHGLILPTSVSV